MNEGKAGRTGRSERAGAMLGSLRAAGLRLTPQRAAVVRELAVDESHPTAQELFDRLRSTLPTMSFATVYNTLDALRSAHLCSNLALSPGSARFDPNVSPHDHLVCDRCGAVRDVPPLGAAGRAVPSARRRMTPSPRLDSWAPGFELRAVERVFRGLCERCLDGALPAATESGRSSGRAGNSARALRRTRRLSAAAATKAATTKK